MRKFLIALCAVGAMSGLGAVGAIAAPISGAGIHNALKTDSMVEKARLYCYNRYTGAFLHWGPCRHDRWRYRHWGHPYWHHRHHWHHHYHHHW